MAEDKQFYVGQKAFIEKEGKVLVLIDIHGIDFPGGKIQEGETDLSESLRREVKEETSLEIEVLEPLLTWLFLLAHDHPHAGKAVYLVGYRCKYISGEVSTSIVNNHTGFRWVGKDNFHELDNGGRYFRALEKYFELEKNRKI